MSEPPIGLPDWGDDLNAYIATKAAIAQVPDLAATAAEDPGSSLYTVVRRGRFEAHPNYADLKVHYGPGPLPPAASMPNTVYYILP